MIALDIPRQDGAHIASYTVAVRTGNARIIISTTGLGWGSGASLLDYLLS